MWTLQLPEISKLCLWKWEYDREFTMHNMNEWTLSSRFVYVVNIDVFFPRIPMIWRHDKGVRQRTSCHSFITTVWWYNILYNTIK
jgi:hypothetical protein